MAAKCNTYIYIDIHSAPTDALKSGISILISMVGEKRDSQFMTIH